MYQIRRKVISKLIHKIFGVCKNHNDTLNSVTSNQKKKEEREGLIEKIKEYSLSILFGKSRAVNIIAIHCSECKSDDILNFDDAELFFKRKFGKKNVYSNSHIPYHFIVTKDGKILDTMPLSAPAIGFSGHLNDGISICYIGFDDKTEEQDKSIQWLISALKDNLGIRTVINA